MRIKAIVLATALTGGAILGGTLPVSASPVSPLPAALASHPFATQKSPTELRAWGPGANDPGNCTANRSEVTGNASEVKLSTTGVTGDCTDIQLPHTYPTVNGYVYEARMYFSNFYQWAAFWMYGSDWPTAGETDAVEANFGVNYFSYHYAPCSSAASSSEMSTNPWSYTCKSTLKTYSANIAAGWHTVDIAYGNHSVSVYYDGKLYSTASGASVVNGPGDPSWVAFSTSSCNAEGNNECATGGQMAGYVLIQWLRIFT
jgi:hypothetical protein